MIEIVVEEDVEDPGSVREFFVDTHAGELRHTLSFEGNGRGVEAKWVVDSPYSQMGFEAEFTLQLTDNNARRLVAAVEREIGRGGRGNADA